MVPASISAVVEQTQPMTVAFMTMRGAYDQMPQAFSRLYGWTSAHGLVPSGPPMGVYLTEPGEMPIEDAAWEVWAPVESAELSEPDENGVGVRVVEPQTVAWAVHVGPFESVGETYLALTDWIAEQGYHLVGAPMEAYLTDPSDVAPEEYRTQIRFPVAPVEG